MGTLTLEKLFGHYGLPPEPFAWIMFGLGGLLAVPAVGRWVLTAASRHVLPLLACAAAALSRGYASTYLHDQSRIIDATAYAFQARALAQGHFTLPPAEVEASVAGRFLLAGPDGVAGIFPPGYPMYLAPFSALNLAMWSGPTLAAGLVVLTYLLARACDLSERASRLAALLSLACGALRYHTADTMSHGLVALALAGTFLLAIQPGGPWRAVGMGALTGVVGLTRFATTLTCLCAFGAYMALLRNTPSPTRRTAAAYFVIGAMPFLAFGAYYFFSITGSPWRSPQALYYALSDTPAGCFRYGFGSGIGCEFEHGDFVRAQLHSGYGALAACKTSLRRLSFVPSDIANFGPLAVLPLAFARRLTRRQRVLGWAVLVQVAAYSPFYFDGNYPGGGARLLADVLPLQHVLLAALLTQVVATVDRRGSGWPDALPASLAFIAFAGHASFEHIKLRDRDGGAPFLAGVAVAPSPPRLIFVDNDAALNLGYALRPTSTIRRLHGDGHDQLVRERLPNLPAFRLTQGALIPLPELPHSGDYRFHGGGLWPARLASGASATPSFGVGPCALAGPALALKAERGPGPSPSDGLPAPAELALRQALPWGMPFHYSVYIEPNGRVDAPPNFYLRLATGERIPLRPEPTGAPDINASCTLFAADIGATHGDGALEVRAITAPWRLAGTSATRSP